jgi:SAM-dependent methyltransferase
VGDGPLQQGTIGARSSERFAKPLFLATIVTGSFLLFLTQPMIARMALPRLGGAPAVWNSAMLVYQALLLGGYAYAHWLSRLQPRRQAGLHLALLAVAALWLPIGLGSQVPSANASPAVWVPWFLLTSIGPLFFIISAQAPLMQRWYALETARGDPYPLYAASNLGSFGGLLSYPLIVEPLLTLEQQSRLWTGGFALLVLLVIGCALTIPGRKVEIAPLEVSPPPGRRRVALWIALAAVPSGLMLSTTTHLTTDIVAVPMLWVVPLGLYLLSFVVAFAQWRRPANFITQIAPVVILIAGGISFADGAQRPLFSATLGLSLLFVVGVALHGQMYRLRPGPDRLTGFYLAMSVGGVLGGAFCALIAPLVFDWAYEHPLLILAAALLIPQRSYLPRFDRIWADPVRRRQLTFALPVLALLLSLFGKFSIVTIPGWAHILVIVAIAAFALFSIGQRFLFAAFLAAMMLSYGGWYELGRSIDGVRTRSYFGIYSVTDRYEGSARMLAHGTTNHGIQRLSPGHETEATSYYTPNSGVGQVMGAAERLFGPAARIGVIGLGTGTLACYKRPGQSWSFFEIDPAMVAIATDQDRFTFLSRCAPAARLIVGDARLTMAQQPPGSFDIIAVDAFSSDAVPMHLLTHEALGVYGRALVPDGLLVFHISNRYLDLEPVLAAGAKANGWRAALMSHQPANDTPYVNASTWIALSRDPAKLASLVAGSNGEAAWAPVRERRGFPGWSDDYASILPLLKGWTD